MNMERKARILQELTKQASAWNIIKGALKGGAGGAAVGGAAGVAKGMHTAKGGGNITIGEMARSLGRTGAADIGGVGGAIRGTAGKGALIGGITGAVAGGGKAAIKARNASKSSLAGLQGMDPCSRSLAWVQLEPLALVS